MHDPSLPHYNHVKRILCYLKGTLDHCIHINNSPPTWLTAYSDAGCPHTGRSTSGFCIFLCNNLIYWSSKIQVMASCSPDEAEYRVGHTLLLTLFCSINYYRSCIDLSNMLLLFIVTTYPLSTCLAILCNVYEAESSRRVGYIPLYKLLYFDSTNQSTMNLS
jgi:hypothetical protein